MVNHCTRIDVNEVVFASGGCFLCLIIMTSEYVTPQRSYDLINYYIILYLFIFPIVFASAAGPYNVIWTGTGPDCLVFDSVRNGSVVYF